jgi:hypothetical protein
MIAIRKIFEEMQHESYFHVEVPIEPGIPRLEYAHLFAFEKNDLQKMLEEAGFEILFKKLINQPDCERYLAFKK